MSVLRDNMAVPLSPVVQAGGGGEFGHGSRGPTATHVYFDAKDDFEAGIRRPIQGSANVEEGWVSQNEGVPLLLRHGLGPQALVGAPSCIFRAKEGFNFSSEALIIGGIPRL